jgi:hypothetical protein
MSCADSAPSRPRSIYAALFVLSPSVSLSVSTWSSLLVRQLVGARSNRDLAVGESDKLELHLLALPLFTST